MTGKAMDLASYFEDRKGPPVTRTYAFILKKFKRMIPRS
jgi:hypothetical protein